MGQVQRIQCSIRCHQARRKVSLLSTETRKMSHNDVDTETVVTKKCCGQGDSQFTVSNARGDVDSDLDTAQMSCAPQSAESNSRGDLDALDRMQAACVLQGHVRALWACWMRTYVRSHAVMLQCWWRCVAARRKVWCVCVCVCVCCAC
jgi:hypothetical protein